MEKRFGLCILTVFTLLFLMPVINADLYVPTYITAAFFLIALVINYIINFILVFIQSKIWLKIKLNKIFIGLIGITILVFIVEYSMTVIPDFLYSQGEFPGENILNQSAIPSFALITFILIAVVYFLVSKYYWKLTDKKSLITSVVMGILTNPAILFFFF